MAGRLGLTGGSGRRRAGLAAAALAMIGTLASACSSPDTAAHGPYAVGVQIESLVDHSRSTPANGPDPAHPGRTLTTTVLFPARGPASGHTVPGATPDRADGPFPLIVFAHGLGSDVTSYLPLLQQWAAAGYVVAAPLFPLTNSATSGGPDLSDYVHQPGDMSFVVTQMLLQSLAASGPLSGLIDPSEVGAAGHSLGGVTTLGLVDDTCCRDARIKAAVVMSGDAISFPTGRVDPAAAPPLLLVHGNADISVPYVSSIDVFNQARAPKGLLTILGGGHTSPVYPVGPAFADVVRTTIDFFDRYLKGQTSALGRLEHDARRGVTTLTFAAQPGAHVVLPVPKTTIGHLHATLSPSTALTNGQAVTVTWAGYTPGSSLNVLECDRDPPTGATDCDLHSADVLHPDPTGAGTLTFTVTTGAVGTGTCDAAHPGCVIVVNQGGSLDQAASVFLPISFAG